MKMRKPCKGRLVNVVLKNAKRWNGKSFELEREARLNACDGAETVEFDCNGALVMPALFGLGLDDDGAENGVFFLEKNRF